MAAGLLTSSASAALPEVSPKDPDTGFPTYYSDSNGVTLQMCLDGLPNCLASRADLIDAHATGGDGEAFYFNADAEVGPVTVANALEAVYAADGPDQEAVFMRSQVSAQQEGALTAGGKYTVTDPYGVLTCTATAQGEIRNNGCRTETTPVALDFTAATRGRIGPFLTWDTYGQAAGAPPAGYIGDNTTPHKVVGSPNGFNMVRIEGPGINSGSADACPTVDGPIANCAETDLFVVQGKVQPGVSASVTPTPVDFGSVASSDPPVTRTVTYTSTGADAALVDTVTVAGADFALADETCTQAALGLTRGSSCTIKVTYTPRAGFTSAGTISITDNTVGSPRTVKLNGSSLARMTAAPASLAFGNQPVGTPSVEDNAVIGNEGVSPLTVASATLTGASASHFKLGTNGCTTPVAPDGGCEIGVVFAPTTTGSKTANLRITDQAGNIANVTLTGTGITAPATPPAAPAAPTATPGDAQATVSWVAPASGGSAITSYSVQVFANGATTPTRTVTGVAGTSTTIGTLTNGTSYTFKVAAVNTVGTGASSAESNAVTPATVPGAPTIGAPTAGNASATVRWTAPTNNGGAAITGYRIRTFSGTTLVKTDDVPAGTSAVIGGLTNGTPYTFDAAATNSRGTGAFSTRSGSATPTAAPTAPVAPAAPTATAGNAQATVSWVAPATGGSAITGYSVQVFAAGATTPTRTVTGIAATATSTVIGTLTNGTSYTFRVVAINAVGSSAASPASNAVTPAAAPTAPVAPAAPTATAGNAQATVSWVAPANGGSAITGYSVQVFANGATTPTRTVTGIAATATGTTIGTLTNGTSYRFRVVAINTVGSSPASPASNAVTPAAAPAAPTAPVAPAAPTATAGNAQATVSWAAPANGGSAITGYSVQVFAAGATTPTRTVTGIAATATSTAVGTLTNGTSYTFRVVAINAVGSSPASPASNAVTPTAGTTPAPAGITVRSSSSATNTTATALGGATTLAVPKPAGAVAGDVLVVSVAARGNPTITPPATTGWTLVRRDPAAGTVLAQTVFTHVVTATDPASWSFGTRSSTGTAANAVGGAIAFTGVSTTAPVNVHAGLTGATASTSATAPSVTTTRANTMLVALYATAAAPTSTTATGAWTPPTGTTEQFDRFTPTTASFKLSVEAATAVQATAGATGTKVATGPSGAPVGQLLALNPAA